MRIWAYIIVFLLGLCPVAVAGVDSDPAALMKGLKTGGHILMIRHALAPGSGDPANFQIGDCSTQRNLDDRGRQQARAIGNRL
ncbi:MAG: histidine phosphatase family protein, partial [Deltaproteobacteria bacterium]|nr:histidine phosphatase family protein [Deltaproteobacteria bacterium]